MACPLVGCAFVEGGVDVVAQAVCFLGGESAGWVAEDDLHKDVLLAMHDPDPGDRLWREFLDGCLGEHFDRFDCVGAASQRGPHAIAEFFRCDFGRDSDREVSADGRHRGHRLVRAEVTHLLGNALVGGSEEAYVVDPLPEHERAVETNAHRQPP
jgi:hypothetical protein